MIGGGILSAVLDEDTRQFGLALDCTAMHVMADPPPGFRCGTHHNS